MKRHKFDLIALLFGLVFLATGAFVIAHELTDSRIDAAWIASFGFVALGVVALVATFMQREHHDVPTPPASPAAAHTDSPSTVESKHPDSV